jgi:hypothetical protein
VQDDRSAARLGKQLLRDPESGEIAKRRSRSFS